MTMLIPCLEDVVRKDSRYAYEAYEFVFAALAHAQKLLGRSVPEGSEPAAVEAHHVSGPELLEGVRDLALHEFGLMARTVFRMWGINRTADFGEIVFNMVEIGLLAKTQNDSREDFKKGYTFDEAFRRPFLPEGKKPEQIPS